MARARPDPRGTAARILAAVLGGRSLNDCAAPLLERLDSPGDRALAQELVYGTLRWLPRLELVAAQLLDKPLRRKDADVQALLLAGLYQLTGMEVAAHAAVTLTAEACRGLNKPWAVKLVNAVLRNHGRRQAAIEAALADQPEYRHAHPQWLLECLRADWPAEWEQICDAGNQRPPMHLRVNLARTDRDACLAALTAAGIEAAPVADMPAAITLARPMPVSALPGFADGLLSVQDLAAQQAAPLLAPAAGQRVLDACAAPGGKTAHLREFCPDIGELLALDVSPARLASVDSTLQRLQLTATTVAADASRPEHWWDGRAFDRILVDAPCTGTGVIRRHPDIKTLRRPGDAEAFAERQLALLEGLWPLLAPGGKLLYATCSVLAQENAELCQGFLSRHPEASLGDAPPAGACDTGSGWQILPGVAAMDGFFYALFQRT